MLVYDPRKTCFAPGCLEWEIQKFLASGKLTDIISTLPPEQLVRVTARAVEGQAEVEWKGPLTLANKQLAIERHNARCSKTNMRIFVIKTTSVELIRPSDDIGGEPF
jgi:hypothetical protein